MAGTIFILNFLVIVLYINVRRFRKLSNKLVVSSAICCMFISIVFIPVNVIEDSGYGKSVPWELAIRGHMTAFETMLLLFHTAALSYDRYILIVHGVRYNQIVTASRVKGALLLVWLCPLIIATFPLIWSLPLKDGKIIGLLFNIYQGLISGMIFIIPLGIIALYMRIYFQQSRQWEEDIHIRALKRRFKSEDGSRATLMDVNLGVSASKNQKDNQSSCREIPDIERLKQRKISKSQYVSGKHPKQQLCHYFASPDIQSSDHDSIKECPLVDNLKETEPSIADENITCKHQDEDISQNFILEQKDDHNSASDLKMYQKLDKYPVAYPNTITGLTLMVSKIRSIRIFIVIFSIIVLCWTPITFINFAEAARIGHHVPLSLIVLSKFTFLIKCIINPLVYNLYSKDGRKAMKILSQRVKNRFCYKNEVHDRSKNILL